MFGIETLSSCICLSVHPLYTDSFTQQKSTKAQGTRAVKESKLQCETIRKILLILLATFSVRKGAGFKSRALIAQISPIFKDVLSSVY